MVKTKNFNPAYDTKLACSCCGRYEVSQEALDKLQKVRDLCNRPLRITSGYRCENHPEEAKKSKGGSHTHGVAFDIAVSNGAERNQVVRQGILAGAKGIGIANTFVHLDFFEDRTVEVMWCY